MESRTSPGERGSVLPISECLAVAFPLCPAWVSRPVERVWVDCLPIVSGGFAQPGSVAVGVRRLLPHLLQQCSCPGYLALLSAPRGDELPWISSATSEVCGRLGYCHVDWLERCAFGVCTPAAQTCARATCANSHSQDQARARFWVPSSLTSDSCLFLPGHRPHVSISSGFPGGVGFLGNPAQHRPAGGSLLITSTTDESRMSSSSVPMICFAFW
jgi:hypothetical protein